MFSKLQALLQARKDQNNFRELSTNDGLIDFCSNDYLGLSQAVCDQKSSLNAASGAKGSRLISGNFSRIQELEEKLSFFHETEEALVFSSGYTANLGVLSAIPQRGDTIFYDALSHASIKDGMRLSHAAHFSFKHNDLEDLSSKLKKAKGVIYVVVEAIYSMDGDAAPLEGLVELSEKHGFCLVVDEAHSVGVFGNRGEGLVQIKGLQDRIPIRIITFGKSLGCHGAAVLCNALVKDYLINYSRPFIYTTANSPRSVEDIFTAYRLMEKGDRTQKLQQLITYFNERKKQLTGDWLESESAVQTLILGSTKKVKEVSVSLQLRGFDVRPILSPTVSVGTERLRFCLHSFNSTEEIYRIIKLLHKV